MVKKIEGIWLVAMIEEKKDSYEVINFLPNIKVNHIEENKFSVVEEPNYIKIPYAEGIDILTAIVGENGVGKTSLINDILSLNDKTNFVFCQRIDSKNIYKQIGKLDLIFDEKNINFDDKIFEASRLDIVKFSTSIEVSEPNDLIRQKEYGFQSSNLSVTESLQGNKLVEVNLLDMTNQILFFDEIVKRNPKLFQKIDSLLNFREKKIVISDVVHLDNTFRTLFAYFYLKGVDEDNIEYFLSKEPYIGIPDKLKLEIKSHLWLLGDLEDDLGSEKIESELFLELKKLSPVNFIELLRNDLSRFNYNGISREEMEKCIDWSDRLLNYSGKIKDTLFNVADYENVFLKYEGLFAFSESSLRERFNSFIDIITEMSEFSNAFLQYCYSQISNAIQISWEGVSSGEAALLRLLGRLFSKSNVGLSIQQGDSIRKRGGPYFESYLLLFDEVDLGLHPEWQRKWVNTVLPIIGELFRSMPVQIIMTTHSPIMLSDIYSEDVIMLQKDSSGKRVIDREGLRTFGQNIHELYRSSFFLESARGEYAMTQINETISTLYELQFWQDQNNRKNDIYKIFCYKRFNRQSSELQMATMDTYKDEQHFLSWFENYSSMKVFIEKRNIETKQEYESFYERYYGNQVKKQGNYTKKFDDYYEKDRSLIRKVKRGEYIFRTRSELEKGIINKFHYQYREKYHKLKEKILKESYFKNNDRKLSEDEKFKMVMKYRIDAIGESLIRKKMFSIYDGVYFSETPTEVTGNNLMDELDNLSKESSGNPEILLKINELKKLIEREGK